MASLLISTSGRCPLGFTWFTLGKRAPHTAPTSPLSRNTSVNWLRVFLAVRLTFGKMTTWLTPSERASRTVSISPLRQFRRYTPGMEAMGSFFSPSCTNTGRMKLAGEMCVSEIALRMVPERRLRRGRDGMSCWMLA